MKQEYHFYVPIPSPSDSIALPQDEVSHFVKSLRGRSGDVIEFTDGNGRLYSATTQTEKSGIHLCNVSLIEEKVAGNLPVLAIGLLKHPDRMEWLVEKAVEIGVKEITWLMTEKSTRYGFRRERLERVAIAAMKQSGRLWLPKISDPVDFKDWIIDCYAKEKFMAHCRPDFEKIPLVSAIDGNLSTVILIGPESDFSETEVRLAMDHGFKSVSLGHSRLRSETAAIMGLSIFSAYCAD